MTYTLPERNQIIDELWQLQADNGIATTPSIGVATKEIELELHNLRYKLGIL